MAPRHLKPRLCRRRLQGQRILAFVAVHTTEGNGIVSVTAARRFAASKKIICPAIIKVRRNEYTVDSFFLAEKGMFGLSYVEFNWMQFSCLNQIIKNIGPREIFSDLGQYDWTSEEESYRPEFAFI